MRVSSSGGTVPPPRDIGSYAQLRALSDEQLERRLDATLGSGTVLHTNFYREEIARRAADRASAEARAASAEMITLTKQIRSLTVTVTAATVIALAIAALALIRS